LVSGRRTRLLARLPVCDGRGVQALAEHRELRILENVKYSRTTT
jgi:hypothetical protein